MTTVELHVHRADIQIVTVEGRSVYVVTDSGPQGPRGPAGIDGSAAAKVFEQATPAASWAFQHGLGRKPIVAVYIAGEEAITDFTADNQWVYVVFGEAQAGSLVVT